MCVICMTVGNVFVCLMSSRSFWIVKVERKGKNGGNKENMNTPHKFLLFFYLEIENLESVGCLKKFPYM